MALTTPTVREICERSFYFLISFIADSVSHHNIQISWHPTSNTRKAEMVHCFDKHDVQHRCDMMKIELYNIIKENRLQYEMFAIDGLSTEWQHMMIRLSLYHPTLNSRAKFVVV